MDRKLKIHFLRFKKITKRVIITLFAIIAVLLVAFHFWFRAHAESVISKLVSNQSNGALMLEMEDFSFNWITNKIKIEKALLLSTDTTANENYQVRVDRINIKAKGFLPMLFDQVFVIDSMRLTNPNVIFTKKGSKLKDTTNGNKISVSQEMGKVADGINDVISVLKIDRFMIDGGSFAIIDKSKENSIPFKIDKILVRLDNLAVDRKRKKNKAEEKVLFSDNISIQTEDQKIVLPDGRHTINFKSFKFNIKNKRVEFDSCTIRARRDDSTRTAFNIYFDKLRLTNINFDSLYRSETIVADSVYCYNPAIRLDVDRDQPGANGRKNKHLLPSEKLDKVLQQLLGDIHLKYVVVDNADINITTHKQGKSNSFKSILNNFEIQGLTVKQNQDHPINIKNFNLALKNREITLQNGRYSINFDSLLLVDNAINLNQFNFKENKNNRVVKNIYVPVFEIKGLSWESLFYDQKFSANTSILLQPTASVQIEPNKKNRSKSVFEALREISDILNLSTLIIRQGNLDFNLANNSSLSFTNANIDLAADELTASKQNKEIKNALKYLTFDKAVYKNPSTLLSLTGVSLNEKQNDIETKSFVLRTPAVTASAANAHIQNVLFNEAARSVIFDDISWTKADIKISMAAKPKSSVKNDNTRFILQHIHGTNTHVHYEKENTQASTFIQLVKADNISLNNKTPYLQNLQVTGNDLDFTNPTQNLQIKDYNIKDNSISKLSAIHFIHKNNPDTLTVNVPWIQFNPDINAMLNNSIILKNIVINHPQLQGQLFSKNDDKNKATKIPAVNINQISIYNPAINLAIADTAHNTMQYQWEAETPSTTLLIKNLLYKNQALSVQHMNTHINNLSIKKNDTTVIHTQKNQLHLHADDITLQPGKEGKYDWQLLAGLNIKEQIVIDSIGKNNNTLLLHAGQVSNVRLKNNIGAIRDIIKNSPDIRISQFSGHYSNIKNNINWFGLGLGNNSFSLDSLQLTPHQSIEAYEREKAFNEDYMSLSTGPVKGSAMDISRWGKDTILSFKKMDVKDLQVYSFKDKTQPDTNTIEKPLATRLVKNLPVKIDIDTIQLHNAAVIYREINPQTNTPGIIPVSKINGSLYNIKNHHLEENDSLYIDATGWVNDRLATHLTVAASYLDSLNGFKMMTRGGAIAFEDFNNVLIPLVGAALPTGYLDSLVMYAMANNHVSIGHMKMYYHNLSVELRNRKNIHSQTFKNKLISWLANTFVISRHNHGKQTPVYFERLKGKSFFNYLIKSNLSGLASGAVKFPLYKKKIRKYQQQQLKAQQSK